MAAATAVPVLTLPHKLRPKADQMKESLGSYPPAFSSPRFGYQRHTPAAVAWKLTISSGPASHVEVEALSNSNDLPCKVSSSPGMSDVLSRSDCRDNEISRSDCRDNEIHSDSDIMRSKERPSDSLSHLQLEDLYAKGESKEAFGSNTCAQEFQIDGRRLSQTASPHFVKLEVVDKASAASKEIGCNSPSMHGVKRSKCPTMEDTPVVQLHDKEASSRQKESEEMVGSGMRELAGSGGDSDEGTDESTKLTFSEQGKLPSSQFKGVVPQPNGRWGAQIYEKHQRVWLGTFNGEEDAAKAYDRAALKFRGRDAMTNFIPLNDADPEATFLNVHTKEQIVDMLRRHIYDEELEQSREMACLGEGRASMGKSEKGLFTNKAQEVQTVSEKTDNVADPEMIAVGRKYSVNCARCLQREHLFEKAVTPSDVGKLNRLVIPKQHAERCFPLDVNVNEKGLLLNFEDSTGKTWRFRYSYWNSSQSYVLTKGWSRFVKEKMLGAGDIVTFERGSNQQLFISWRRRPCAPQQSLLHVTSLLRQSTHIGQLQNTPCTHSLAPLNCSPWLRVVSSNNTSLHPSTGGVSQLKNLPPFSLQAQQNVRTQKIPAVSHSVYDKAMPPSSQSGSVVWHQHGFQSRTGGASKIDSGCLNRALQAGAIPQPPFLYPSGNADHGVSCADKQVLGFSTLCRGPNDLAAPWIRRDEISVSIGFRDRADPFVGINKVEEEKALLGMERQEGGFGLSSDVGNIDTTLTLGRYNCYKETEPSLFNETMHAESEATRHGLRLFGVDLRPSLWSTTQRKAGLQEVKPELDDSDPFLSLLRAKGDWGNNSPVLCCSKLKTEEVSSTVLIFTRDQISEFGCEVVRKRKASEGI